MNQPSSMPRSRPEVIVPSPPRSLIRAKIASASASSLSVSASTYHEPPSGSATLSTPVSSVITCWVRSAICAALRRRQREHLVQRVRVQRVRAGEHRGQRLDRGAHDVVVRLLRGERDPGGLGVEAQPLRPLGLRAVHVAHPARPDPPRGAQLRDLLEEVDVRVEEERQPRREPVDRPGRGTCPARRSRSRRRG